MPNDFRSSQIQIKQIISSGSLASGTGAKLVIYPIEAQGSPNNTGIINQSIFNTSSLNGRDIFLFVSGGINERGTNNRSISVFGGDLHVSGNLTFGGGSIAGNQWVEGTPSPRLRTTASIAIGSSVVWAEDKDPSAIFYVSGNLYENTKKVVIDSFVHISNSLAIGQDHVYATTQSNSTLIVGSLNIISGVNDSSAVIGSENKINNVSSIGVVGFANDSDGVSTLLVVGSNNQTSLCDTNLIVGGFHSLSGSAYAGIIGGVSNKIEEYSNNSIILGGVSNIISGNSSDSLTNTGMIAASYASNINRSQYVGILNSHNSLITGSFVSSIISDSGSLIQNYSSGSIILSSNKSFINNSKYAIIAGVANTGSNLLRSNIIGGTLNVMSNSNDSNIIGGSYNKLTGSDTGTIIGGNGNTINGSTGVGVFGGNNNVITASSIYSYTFGSYGSSINGSTGILVGGQANTINDSYNGFVGGIGGFLNVFTGSNTYSYFFGGQFLTISSSDVSVIVGTNNATLKRSQYTGLFAGRTLHSDLSLRSGIVAGFTNRIYNVTSSIILAGEDNSITGSVYSSVLVSSTSNVLYSTGSIVIGGNTNTITASSDSVVIGGTGNTITLGQQSFIAGNSNNANNSAVMFIAGAGNNADGNIYGFFAGASSLMKNQYYGGMYSTYNCFMTSSTNGYVNTLIGGISNINKDSWGTQIIGGDTNIAVQCTSSIILGAGLNVTGAIGEIILGGKIDTRGAIYPFSPSIQNYPYKVTVSASRGLHMHSGSIYAWDGLSGSLQRTTNGNAFIIGNGITVNTNSLGQIELTGSAGVTLPTRQFIAAMNTTTTTASNLQTLGSAYFVPSEHNSTTWYLKTILAANAITNTAYVRLYNITSGAYVEIGGTGVTALSTSNTTPTVLSSSNLKTAVNFNPSTASIYELRFYGSGSTPITTHYGAEIVCY